jgi:integrase
MKNRYRIYIRGKHSGGKVWWIQNNQTNQRESLHTTDKAEAKRLLDLKNQPHHFNGFHVQMARTHLLVSDPQSATRTWQSVMDSIVRKKTGSTKDRWERAAQCEAFDTIRNLVVADTKSDDFERVLDGCNVSTNMYLRRLHNYAMDMNWLLAPVIAKRAWPKIVYGEKRAITLAEHQRIVDREKNPERKAFYELCWQIGGAQSDIAKLTAADIDWQNHTISYDRKKTKQTSTLTFGSQLEQVLRSLPTSGNLFPYLAGVREADRATEFRQRCKGLNIEGVTLHSYRYAWAERALAAGYPERYAQKALGHGSKAIARTYAKNANVLLPSLESYERKIEPVSNN